MVCTALTVLALAAVPRCASAADLDAVRPAAEWLRTERLRGTLFHQASIDPMPTRLIEPAQSEGAAGGAAPVTLRGRHYLLVVVDDNGRLGLTIRNVDASEHFDQAVFAVYSPEGEELRAGLVPLNGKQTVALKGLQAGTYVVLLNSGPAMSNAVEVTVRNRHWAIDGASHRDYERCPMHYHFLRDLKLGGFNLAMVDVERLEQSFGDDEGRAAWTELVKRWTDYAAKVKLRVMPSVNLGGSAYETELWDDLPEGLFTENPEGKLVGRCPLRREYWETMFLRRGREVAKLALENPYIVGYALDPEMYQSWSYGHYMLGGTCFCDHCLGGFLKSKGMDEAVLREKTTGTDRHQWLADQNLRGEYFGWLADQMADIAAWCRDDLHAIDPDLLLCMFVIEIGNWFCEGIARGFSEPDLPAVNFCEHTYYSVGYDREWLDKTHQRYRDWGANVLQGSALWDLHFPPTKPGFLAAHAYNLAVNDEGWWYWPGDRLYRDWGATHAYLDQPAYLDEYWQACVWANSKIERTLKEPGRDSPLAEAEVVPWKGKIKSGGIEAPEDVVRGETHPPFPLCVAAPTTLYFAIPERVQEFTLVCQARGDNNDAVVRVLDPNGSEVAVIGGELDGPEELRVEVTEPGIWSVEAESDGDRPLRAVSLRMDGPPSLFAPSPASCLMMATKKPGLVGYWALDEGEGARTADTSQPPACNGIVSGAEWVEGKIGKALQFDGKSGGVSINANWAYNNLSSFSLSAWVRLDALPVQGNGASLVNKGPEAPVQHFWWWIGYPPNYSIVLELGSEGHQWGQSFGSDPQTWELGRWYHVATTFESEGGSSTAVFYRDGEKVGEKTVEEPFHSGAHDLKLGTYGGLHWLNGALDEVKLWDRVLTAEEVQAEYGRGGDGGTKGPKD